MGVDGISLPLVLLTGLTCWLAMLASSSIQQHLKGYVVLFLLLETGILGTFLALDFFLFYVFWEVMLLPMYFLIGVWGGPRKEYAAIKFFLYTFFGGVLMLIAMLMLYFSSGASLADCTFDLLRLARIGQGRELLTFSNTLQVTAFALLAIGFLIKLPAVPVHTWLPDAHVEAPTPISMILAGVLLKMGAYGLLRVGFPICPAGAQAFASTLVVLGVISILYGALAAMAQTDFKRLVAYSSVSHMGYVLLGMGVWKVSEQTGVTLSRDAWEMGLNAAIFQLVAHGITSTGMFFLVGVLYDRVHHRELSRFGGLAGLMPQYTGIAAGIFFAALGLPGLCGFIGEAFSIFAAWHYSPLLTVLAALGMILTAGYVLWMIQRVYFGPEYRGPHADQLRALTSREAFIGSVLLGLAIFLGIYPPAVLRVTAPSVTTLAQRMDLGYRAAHQVREPEKLGWLGIEPGETR
jgi:NADH-quinone oxidoreductase subunit M